MSAAAVEHPCDPCDGEPPTLLEEAERLMELLPGQQIVLPSSIGAEVKLDAAELLKAAQRRTDGLSG